MRPLKVAVLGSGGMIGKNYVALLQNHPWFTLTDPGLADLFFSALPKEAEKEYDKPLISSSSRFRLRDDVPLIIPEVNAHHLELIRGKNAFIVAKPNCSVQSYLLPLTPLHRAFGVTKIHITMLQAISGAGKAAIGDPLYLENVLPFIPDEEEKSENEPKKIWDAPELTISVTCTRVPVLHGHLASLSVSFREKPTIADIVEQWRAFKSLDLPSAPRQLIYYEEDPMRPQTKLDVDREKGMAVTVGRLRSCPLFDYRFLALSHNAIRGGAGGGVLIAELLYKEGFLGTT